MTRFDGRTGVASGLGLAALVAASVVLGSVQVRAEGARDEQALAVERKDSEIRKDVADQVLRYAWYTVFDSIEAGVDNGVVLLRGSVNQPYRKSDIEKRVAK